MSSLYGYIFSWDVGTDKEGKTHQLKQALSENSGFRATHNESVRNLSRWEVFIFRSQAPLKNEEQYGENLRSIDLSYEYAIYFRMNELTGSVIIASERRAVTDAAIKTLSTTIKPSLRRKVINVESLAEHLLAENAPHYAITYFMADVPGYGSALKTISLHGEDIAAVDFLDGERSNFTARQIGVRPINGRYECGRFTNTGSIQFRLLNIRQLEEFLSYAHTNKFYIE